MLWYEQPNEDRTSDKVALELQNGELSAHKML